MIYGGWFNFNLCSIRNRMTKMMKTGRLYNSTYGVWWMLSLQQSFILYTERFGRMNNGTIENTNKLTNLK